MLKTQTIIFFAFLSLPLVYELKVHADLFGGYVSSQESKKVEQRRTVGSGSRSNCQSIIAKNSVSLLVPEQEVVHHTSLKKPSFFLIANKLSDTKNFQFTLVDPQIGTTLVEKNISVSEGIKQIEVPESTSLQLDKVYLWYVAIPCANNPEKYREVLGAAIKRTELNPYVKTQLHQAKSDLETAAIYAENGFWYEALEIAVQERNRKPGNIQVNNPDYLDQLLNSAELDEVSSSKNR